MTTTRSRSAWRADLATGLGLLCAISAMPVYLGWVQWEEVRALRAEWTIPGPACAQVDEIAPWARRRKRAPISFSYGPAVWTRSFAAVSCAAVPKSGLWSRGSYYVCSFNNPGAVVVRTAGREVIFQPPPGGKATVTVRDGVASCVVGGRFSY
jgi:hypothetical protein